MSTSQHPTDDAIVLWVTGELVGSDALALEAHVAACPGCSARLADESALEVVLYAAAEDDEEIVELVPSFDALADRRAERARASGVLRQVLGVAAGFALMLLAGRGALEVATVDAIEPALGVAPVAIGDGPASWDDGATEPICQIDDDDDDGALCDEPSDALIAMASFEDSAPALSGLRDSASTTPGDGSCAPVDTGESSTCDDWLLDADPD